MYVILKIFQDQIWTYVIDKIGSVTPKISKGACNTGPNFMHTHPTPLKV